MPSNHLILCCPLLLLPSIFPNIRVFSNESVLCIRWPKYWNFSFSISPSKDYSGLISFQIDWTLTHLSLAISGLLSGVEGGFTFCFLTALGLCCSTQYLHCGMWDLDLWPGTEPEPSAWSESGVSFYINFLFCFRVEPINNAVIASGEQQRDSVTHVHVSILPQRKCGVLTTEPSGKSQAWIFFFLIKW